MCIGTIEGEKLMKKKSLFGLLTLVVMLVALAACGSKENKNGVPNILKDKYTGYSKAPGYDGLIFSEGGSELAFDKKENKITNLNTNESKYFKVFPKDKLNSKAKGVLVKHEAELKGKDYFIIAVGNDKKEITDGILYGVVLSDGGNTIRIFEFDNGAKALDYLYDFIGKTNK